MTRKGTTGASTHAPVVVASVLVTVASVYPAFLVGGLGVQLREELAVSESFFGVIFGSFFAGAMIGSAVLGRVVERVGAKHAITAGLVTIAILNTVIGLFVRSAGVLLVLLAVAGFANSANQTGANKLLSQSADRSRLGIAMAIKQSGMPSGTLLAGLAVPAIALTVGWPAAYLSAAVLALIALVAVRLAAPADRPSSSTEVAVPTTPIATLRFASLGAALAAATAGSLSSWVVSSATDAGMGAGAAGLLLSAGSVAGISVRLITGRQLDVTSRHPITIAGALLFLGAFGMAALAIRSSTLHIFATLLAFGSGWAWPVGFNYGVVRANVAAGAATGITQTGVYIGVLVGPIVTGWMIETYGYQPAWLLVAVVAICAGGVMLRVAPAI